MSTVFGPRRMNAGVHPLKRNLGPSSRKERVKTSSDDWLEDCGKGSAACKDMHQYHKLTADMRRDLRTSAGAQTAVRRQH